MSKPVLGQIVFSLNVGNAARSCEQELSEMVVTKVGRKYFTARMAKDLTGYSDTQYHLDNWRQKTDYSTTSYLYADKQEYLEEAEEQSLCEMIYPFFESRRNTKKLSLSVLRKIHELCKL